VTGALGAAAAGLRLLAQGARLGPEGQLDETGVWTASSAAALQHCLQAQLDPAPPLAFARSLAEQPIAHAAIDLSDGLSRDLLTVCEASGVGATLVADGLPLDGLAAGLERAQGGDARSLALHGGEDYQLLLAVPPSALDALKELAAIWDLATTVAGEFTAGEPVVRMDDGSQEVVLAPRAHDHFLGDSRGGRSSSATEA
jgi:thiamine-monophosphate kinase